MKNTPDWGGVWFLVASSVYTFLKRWKLKHGAISLSEQEVIELLQPLLYPRVLGEGEAMDDEHEKDRDEAWGEIGRIICKDPNLSSQLLQVIRKRLMKDSDEMSAYWFWLQSPFMGRLPEFIYKKKLHPYQLAEINAVAYEMGYEFTYDQFKTYTQRLTKLQEKWPKMAAELWGE